MLLKSYILYTFGFSYIFILSIQVEIKHTGLIDHEKYMQDAMQMLINDLEEEGLSQWRLKDFNMEINDNLYGFEVKGNLHYFNGFAISIESAAIKYNTIMKILNDTSKMAYVRCELQMEEIQIAYDLEANLTDSYHTATGTYPVKNMDWKVQISKNLETDEINVDIAWSSKGNDQTKKIVFLPKNDYTAVFSRGFNTSIDEVHDSLVSWQSDNFEPILEKIVRNKIPFPKLSYETHLDGIS